MSSALGDRPVAAVTLDLLGVRVDREHLAPGVAQAAIDQVRGLLGTTRDPGHGDPQLGQELRGGVSKLRHTGVVHAHEPIMRCKQSPRIGVKTRAAIVEKPH
jgi:hypothetical protein